MKIQVQRRDQRSRSVETIALFITCEDAVLFARGMARAHAGYPTTYKYRVTDENGVNYAEFDAGFGKKGE